MSNNANTVDFANMSNAIYVPPADGYGSVDNSSTIMPLLVGIVFIILAIAMIGIFIYVWIKNRTRIIREQDETRMLSLIMMVQEDLDEINSKISALESRKKLPTFGEDDTLYLNGLNYEKCFLLNRIGLKTMIDKFIIKYPSFSLSDELKKINVDISLCIVSYSDIGDESKDQILAARTIYENLHTLSINQHVMNIVRTYRMYRQNEDPYVYQLMEKELCIILKDFGLYERLENYQKMYGENEKYLIMRLKDLESNFISTLWVIYKNKSCVNIMISYDCELLVHRILQKIRSYNVPTYNVGTHTNLGGYYSVLSKAGNVDVDLRAYFGSKQFVDSSYLNIALYHVGYGKADMKSLQDAANDVMTIQAPK